MVFEEARDNPGTCESFGDGLDGCLGGCLAGDLGDDVLNGGDEFSFVSHVR